MTEATGEPMDEDRPDSGAPTPPDVGTPGAAMRSESVEQLEAELAAARRTVELQREIGRAAAAEAVARIRVLERRVARLTAAVESLRASASATARMPAVRVSRALRRWRRRLGDAGGRPAPASSPTAGRPSTRRAGALAADEQRLVAAIRGGSLPDAPPDAPLISMILPNVNGAPLLRRCLPSIAATAWPRLELILVDGATADDSLGVLNQAKLPFPVTVIRSEDHATFSDACEAALVTCHGDVVLLLHDDVEPIDPRWLACLAESLDRTGADAVGARLVHSASATDGGASSASPLSLQQAGIAFRLVEGGYLPVPLGANGDPVAPWASEGRTAPAVSAACLLMRRSALERVGGFSAVDELGLGDADLCLRLQAAGSTLTYDGRAALWHHGSASRPPARGETNERDVEEDRERFISTWGPRLFRTVLLDALAGGSWLADGLRVHVLAPPEVRGHPASSAVAALGWHEIPEAADADIQIVADPALAPEAVARGSVLVAWIDGDVDAWDQSAWLPDADVVVAAAGVEAADLERRLGHGATTIAADDAGTLLEALRAWAVRPHVAIHLEESDWARAVLGGDLPYARDLQRALQRRGRPTRVRLRTEWEAAAGGREDVTIMLMGRTPGRVRDGQVNVLWQISHPELAMPDDYARFDLAFAASGPLARHVSSAAGITVGLLPQATDPERFRPDATGPRHELLFVANSRITGRHIIVDLLPTTHQLAVYGQRWDRDGLEPRYLAGTNVPNDQLPGYYASAAIVLNDHWSDMRREAMLSNRLFDASAAGAFVISDDVESLNEVFDGGVVAYRTAAELKELVDWFMAHPEARAERASRARAAVIRGHTFDHRAATLLDAVRPLEHDRDTILAPVRDGHARPTGASAN